MPKLIRQLLDRAAGQRPATVPRLGWVAANHDWPAEPSRVSAAEVQTALTSLDHAGQHPTEPVPLPRRGDHVEAWLKAQRDEYDPDDGQWSAIDLVLDDYRLHADTSTPLNQHCCEGSFCDCEEANHV